MVSFVIRFKLFPACWLLLIPAKGLFAAPFAERLAHDFMYPPRDCRPYTYWFWPASAVTEQELTWELQQMYEQGMGGVLINSAFGPIYEKGAIPFLSDDHLKMIRHAVLTAKKLGLKVILNFSGGWVFGGFWVPPEQRSQSLVPASVELKGPVRFSAELPKFVKAADHRGEISVADIPDGEKLVAVVAGEVKDGRMISSSLVDLTSQVADDSLSWTVPQGLWRLTVFWLKYTGQKTVPPDYGQVHWCVDHFSRSAMKRYCEFIGGKYLQAVGDEFGKTIIALHCDSYEMASLPDGFYWSDSLLSQFHAYKGYDLTRYLPALWWPIDDLSANIRYDVNDFLHQAGLGIFFQTFLDWCHRHHLQASMEPYGFTTDILEGAGMADLPFMEVTAGEKDAVPWFDNRIGPKRYVASGADLYGRNIIGVEAYTYLHWEIYRATLEELKIASDGFLCSGANLFFNHLYAYTPERQAAPSRTLPWAAVINHTNLWWKDYHHLADYIARCCFLLRQGLPQKDIAVYSPLANQWTLDVKNARKWTREYDWGALGELIFANGYQFDLINDEVLQHRAAWQNGVLTVNNMEYRILLLPDISAMPVETLEVIRRYVADGGVAIALKQLPKCSVGLSDHAVKDLRVQSLIREMFAEPVGRDGTGEKSFDKGRTHFIKQVLHRQDVLDRRSSPLDPFVNTLRAYLPPDVSIDFASAGLRENNGLSFFHRRLGEDDLYFVANIQDRPFRLPLTFRVCNKIPWHWNPYDGSIARLWHYEQNSQGIELPIELAPFESLFVLFQTGLDSSRISAGDFHRIVNVKQDTITAAARMNGRHHLLVQSGRRTVSLSCTVQGVPPPFDLAGPWRMTLADAGVDTVLTHLESWTVYAATRHFSGAGRYETHFTIPYDYLNTEHKLFLELGKVGSIAHVQLNGKQIGTHWMSHTHLPITSAVRPGDNHLVVEVINTLINRAAGLRQPIPVPAELISHYGSGTTAYTETFRGPVGFAALPASGLIGPVRIIAEKITSIPVR